MQAYQKLISTLTASGQQSFSVVGDSIYLVASEGSLTIEAEGTPETPIPVGTGIRIKNSSFARFTVRDTSGLSNKFTILAGFFDILNSGATVFATVENVGGRVVNGPNYYSALNTDLITGGLGNVGFDALQFVGGQLCVDVLSSAGMVTGKIQCQSSNDGVSWSNVPGVVRSLPGVPQSVGPWDTVPYAGVAFPLVFPIDARWIRLRITEAVTGGATPGLKAMCVFTQSRTEGSNSAQDGTDATGIVAPAGGVGLRGWLSGIYDKLSNLVTVSLPVCPTVTAVSVATANPGVNYTAFGALACTRLEILNDTAVNVEYRRNGGGVAVPIPAGVSRLVLGITNANQVSVRRIDNSNTAVTVKAEAFA